MLNYPLLISARQENKQTALTEFVTSEMIISLIWYMQEVGVI
jgi:hypothetical protein